MLKDSKTDMGFLTIFSKTYPSLLTFNQGIFLKSTRPSLPLKKAPPLFSVALNRFAIRLTDHHRSRQVVVRDGTAWLRVCDKTYYRQDERQMRVLIFIPINPSTHPSCFLMEHAR